MPVFDISLGIEPGMMVWPGDPLVVVEETSRMARGDLANVSTLRLGTHTGTHVDPPCHFIDGAVTVDEIPPDVLVGPAVVLDLRAVAGEITPQDLCALPDGAERVLFRTCNSDLWARGARAFPEDYVSLGLEGARWLAARGVRLVGTDFLSIEQRGAPGHPVHVALLEAGVVIVEGLDLHAVDPGDYTFMCLPLKVSGGDGAPARALLSRA
ncbi:MAG: cyclase family protein [Actinomycetota bacterium]